MVATLESTAPPPLCEGDRVAIVAPSGFLIREDFERGVARLRLHYEVSCRDDVLAKDGYLAGSDARRAEELTAALTDDSIKAVLAARGGYGAARIVDRIDWSQVRASPKLLVGFSDITAMHAQFARVGVRSLHATMACGVGRASEEEFGAWRAAVAGEDLPDEIGLATVVGGVCEGRMVGGNLAVLCGLVGTPYFPSFAGGIVFLEDVGERPYRVDRLLTTLLLAGAFSGARGIVLGDFSGAEPGPDGVSLPDVLVERLRAIGLPSVIGLRAGHCTPNHAVPLGVRGHLDASAGVLRYLEGVTLGRLRDQP